MKNKTFTVAELYNLREEIALLLREKLRATLRVDLVDLLDQVSKILTPVEETRKELVLKYLSGDDDIPVQKKPGFPEFEKEMLEVIAMTRDISYSPIKKELLNFDTDKDYRLIFKLVEKEEKNIPIPS